MAIDAIVSKKKPTIHYPRIEAAPLVEIFSVSIQRDNQCLPMMDEKACEIYGRIRVIDKLREAFDIYERDKDQAESLYLGRGGSLLLTAPSDPQTAVIIASDHVKLDVVLFDRAFDDIPIIKGEITLDRSGTTSDWEDDTSFKIIKGNHGFSARVEYGIFPYAVVANVSVLFFHKDDHFDTFVHVHDDYNLANEEDIDVWLAEKYDEQDVNCYKDDNCSIMADVFGTVTASAGRSSKGSILFRKPIDDGCVKVKSGGFIELSRSVVAVPAYSSLQIEASFSDRDTLLPIASGIVKFKPRDCYTFKEDIVGDNGRIRVRVTWSDAYEQLQRASSTLKRVLELTSDSSESGKSSDDSLGKRQTVLLENQPSAAASSANCITTPIEDVQYPMLEVFSVVVCHGDFKEPFKFHGVINVQNGEAHCIFNKSESHPQVCPTSGMLAVFGNADSHAVEAVNGFSITLNLRDNTGASVSRGHIIWRNTLDNMLKCTNKRMCTVVRGERGFAAVHYMIIQEGLSGALDVKLYSRSLPGRIKGKLYARYGNCDYSRSYDEKYFQSILFYEENDGVRLDSSGSTLPLVKPFVAVPKTTHLVIVANLSVSPIDDKSLQDVVCLKGCVELRGDGVSSWRIGNDDLYLDVSVVCKGPWRLGGFPVEYSRPW